MSLLNRDEILNLYQTFCIFHNTSEYVDSTGFIFKFSPTYKVVSWLYVQDPYQKKQRGIDNRELKQLFVENMNRNLRYANFYHPAMSFGAWWNFNFCTRDSGELGPGAQLKLHPLYKYFWKAVLTGWKDSSRCQVWHKIDGNIVFFRAGCGECRTRRSYSLDRIHVHDSYFLFPFQNIFLRQFFSRIAFCGKVFAAIYLLANDPL